MALSQEHLAFVEAHPSAAMITPGADGFPKAARVAITVVDGKIWSSGTADRVRTRRLRRDPRCTLFVFDAEFAFLTLETTVTLLEGPDAIDQSVHMFRVMQKRPTGPISWFEGDMEEEAFRQRLIDDHRLIYQFEVQRSYGIT